jgi:LPS O-antigen subunit length determinant protein (WzzB/FepE family)
MNDQREWSDDGEIDLFRGVLFLWHARYLIVALTLSFALIALVATLVMPRNYTASTEVLVTVPALASVPADPTTADRLDRLAQSTSVRASTEAQLTSERYLEKGATVTSYRTSVDKSAVDQSPSVAILTLSVGASTSELARRAADVWADIIVKEYSRNSEKTLTATVEFFTSQYKIATEQLVARRTTLEQARQQRGLLRDRGDARQAVSDPAVALEEAELNVARSNLKRAGQRLDEAQLLLRARSSSARVVSPAASPTSPTGLPTARIVGLAALAGFALALFVAWVRSRFRSMAAATAR